MAVVAGNGVVGIVEEVTRFTSTVLLAIDPGVLSGMVLESGDRFWLKAMRITLDSLS